MVMRDFTVCARGDEYVDINILKDGDVEIETNLEHGDYFACDVNRTFRLKKKDAEETIKFLAFAFEIDLYAL